jgi:hypothetical protein
MPLSTTATLIPKRSRLFCTTKRHLHQWTAMQNKRDNTFRLHAVVRLVQVVGHLDLEILDHSLLNIVLTENC